MAAKLRLESASFRVGLLVTKDRRSFLRRQPESGNLTSDSSNPFENADIELLRFV